MYLPEEYKVASQSLAVILPVSHSPVQRLTCSTGPGTNSFHHFQQVLSIPLLTDPFETMGNSLQMNMEALDLSSKEVW